MNPLSLERKYGERWLAKANIAPSAELLGRVIYAVHATDDFPSDGILHAGAKRIYREEVSYSSTRKTVHFALGGLVPSHAGGEWESRKYAIITPLSTLQDQLVNVMPIDTFVAGDFLLPQEAVIIAPKGDQIPDLPKQNRIYFYDDQHSTLRNVISKVIKEYGGWEIEMYPDRECNTESAVNTLKAYPKSNLAQPSFWRKLLKDFPRLSFGYPTFSLHGVSGVASLKSITIALEELEKWFIYPKDPDNLLQISERSHLDHKLLYYESFLKTHLARLEGNIDQTLYNSLQQDVEKWGYFLKLYDYMRKEYHVSLLGSQLTYDDYSKCFEKDIKALEADLASLTKVQDRSLVVDSFELGLWFSTLPLDEICWTETSPEYDDRFFKAGYYINRMCLQPTSENINKCDQLIMGIIGSLEKGYYALDSKRIQSLIQFAAESWKIDLVSAAEINPDQTEEYENLIEVFEEILERLHDLSSRS